MQQGQHMLPGQRVPAVGLGAEDLGEMVDIGHELALEDDLPALYERTLTLLEPAIGSTSSVFFGAREHGKSVRFEEGTSRGVPLTAPREWSESYQSEDPFVVAMLNNVARHAPPVAVSSELVKHSEYIKSDFYNLFLRPQSIYHVMVIGLLMDGAPIGLFGFHRPYGAPPFTQREVTKAGVLVPALISSIRRVRAEEALHERNWILDTLSKDIPHKGVVILDDALNVEYANEGAREILQLPPDSGDNKLPVTDELRRACSHLLQDGGQEASAALNAGAQRFQAKIHTFQKSSGEVRHAMYLGAPGGQVISQQRMQQHGLSTREIEVVHMVASGLTNPQVAEKLFISPRTVQNHLRSIYAKVGVHNRTRLLYKLASKDT